LNTKFPYWFIFAIIWESPKFWSEIGLYFLNFLTNEVGHPWNFIIEISVCLYVICLFHIQWIYCGNLCVAPIYQKSFTYFFFISDCQNLNDYVVVMVSYTSYLLPLLWAAGNYMCNNSFLQKLCTCQLFLIVTPYLIIIGTG
jgi:hypothetical protein